MSKRVGGMILLLMAMGILWQSSARADSLLFDRSALYVNSWGDFSDVDGGREAASSFHFTEDSYVTRIEWWGEHFPGGTVESPGGDDFTVRFYADNGGLPGLLMSEFNVGDVDRASTGIFTNYAEVFHYESTITATEFDAGTSYWLSIQNNTSGGISNRWGWHYSTPLFSPNGVYRTETGAWSDHPNFAYRLNGEAVGVVPVPAPAALGLLGMGLVASIRCRRKSAKV